MFKVPTFQESKEKSLFYTRQQGSSTFNFYVGIDKQLIAEMVKDGKNKLFQIDGVPCDLQKELNEEKLKKLQKALDQCFFSTEKGKVLLKIRGNGGWGDDLHRGYDGKKEDKWEPWLLLKAGIRFKKFNKKSKRHFIYHGEGVQGTFKWAKETGLGGKHDLIAAHIAHYSNSIDYNPMTNPFVDQSWHFNLSPKEADGSMRDSRLLHVLDKLIKAIMLYKEALHLPKKKDRQKKMNEAFDELGRGLHPLQDVFAHTSAFVHDLFAEVKIAVPYGVVPPWLYLFAKIKRFKYHDFMWAHADNPYYICEVDGKSPKTQIDDDKREKNKKGGVPSQRYSDTKLMTYLYLLFFRLATEPAFFHSEEYQKIIHDLKINYRIANSNHELFSVPIFTAEISRRLQQAGLGTIPEDDVIFLDRTVALPGSSSQPPDSSHIKNQTFGLSASKLEMPVEGSHGPGYCHGHHSGHHSKHNHGHNCAWYKQHVKERDNPPDSYCQEAFLDYRRKIENRLSPDALKDIPAPPQDGKYAWMSQRGMSTLHYQEGIGDAQWRRGVEGNVNSSSRSLPESLEQQHPVTSMSNQGSSSYILELENESDENDSIVSDIPVVVPAGLVLQVVPGDGHCLYRAVSYYLQHGEDPAWLRRIIAANIEANRERYRQLIPDDMSLEEYTAELRNTNAFTDDLEINVLMRLLDRPIVIIGSDGEIINPNEIDVYYDNLGNVHPYTGEPIFVFYNGEDHYDALLLQTGFKGRDILSCLRFAPRVTHSVEYPPTDIGAYFEQIAKNVSVLRAVIGEGATSPREDMSIICRALADLLNYLSDNHRFTTLIAIRGDVERLRNLPGAGISSPMVDMRIACQGMLDLVYCLMEGDTQPEILGTIKRNVDILQTISGTGTQSGLNDMRILCTGLVNLVDGLVALQHEESEYSSDEEDESDISDSSPIPSRISSSIDAATSQSLPPPPPSCISRSSILSTVPMSLARLSVFAHETLHAPPPSMPVLHSSGISSTFFHISLTSGMPSSSIGSTSTSSSAIPVGSVQDRIQQFNRS
ncbi:MAG: hypothetical protein A2X78_04030 [Gammaproteobacteria bacterium GWE2_37_16]|nr:MAG: hypothetical protein A2X78_04030 [Gammaproteobacteria bacterium GWE2_37_16]